MNKHLTAEDLDRIEKAAKGAPPVPWVVHDVGEGPKISGPEVDIAEDGQIFDAETAEYIATADPSTVLALVAEVRHLRGLANDPDAISRIARDCLDRDAETFWFLDKWDDASDERREAYLVQAQDAMRFVRSALLSREWELPEPRDGQ